MKRVNVLLTLLAATSLALFGGKVPSGTSKATIFVSCSVCTAGEPMTITGSGYAARKAVVIYISGTDTTTMSINADSKGKINMYYPTGIMVTSVSNPTGEELSPGYYTLTASQSGGASATTNFAIQ